MKKRTTGKKGEKRREGKIKKKMRKKLEKRQGADRRGELGDFQISSTAFM